MKCTKCMKYNIYIYIEILKNTSYIKYIEYIKYTIYDIYENIIYDI